MVFRLFVSATVILSALTMAMAQAPEARKDAERAARAFAFSFDGDGGYLGVQTKEVTKENFATYGLRGVRGVAVEKVMDNSPAAAAGLQAGDVILRLGADEITSTRKLSRLVSEIAPDHQISLTIARGGREQDVTATLAKRPAPKFEDGNFTFAMPEGMKQLELDKLRRIPEFRDLPQGDMRIFRAPDADGKGFTWTHGSGRQIGVSIYPLTKQLAERHGVDGGVMINNVREDSPAAKAGLRAGDIITEVDGKAVKNTADLVRAISDKKEGDVSLTIYRDRSRQTINVTPEAAKGAMFFHNEDGDLPLSPAPMGTLPLLDRAVPAAPTSPVIRSTPAPMTLLHPGRVI